MGKNLVELTSLRFFAAAYVVLLHIFHSIDEEAGFFSLFVKKGYIGVDFFFILSGFILTYVYFDRYQTNSFQYGRFLLNRLARVYPLHLFILFLFFFAHFIRGDLSSVQARDWSDLPFHILSLHAWGFTDAHAWWNYPSWSISAEAFAYLLFPFFLVLAAKIPARVGLALSCILLIAAYLVSVSMGTPLTSLTYNFGIIRVFFEFLLGVFICCTYEKFHTGYFTSILFFMMSVGIILGSIFLELSDLVIILALGSVIYFTACLSAHSQWNPLRFRVFEYLGEISYTIYMVHILALVLVKKTLYKLASAPPTDIPGLYIAVSTITIIISSIAIYHFFEVPMRNTIRNLGKNSQS